MKNSKKGVSLIVLVVTVIVMIIIAGAVILSMNNNNPVNNAKKATFDSDLAEVQSAVSLYISNYMAKTNGKSPFLLTTGTIPIGTKNRIPEPVDSVTNMITTPEPQDLLSWTDLGLKEKPKTIKSATLNVATGDVVAVKE